MIDSHCHLNFPKLKENIKKIILNSQKNNINCILTINTDPKEFDDHLKLINKYKSIYISYGLHPQNINNQTSFSKENIIPYCNNEKVIAIGETGLDFYHDCKYKKKQYEVFEEHIEASIKTKLPIVIHQRNSEREIIEVIKSFNKSYKLSVVFHCFTGSKKLLNFCLENQYYISLSGIITFKNAYILRETVKNISLNLLLLETDSPFLTPVPMRGKTNEPSFIKYTAEFLSNFYDIPLIDFIKLTDNNFYKLFSKAKRYTDFK